MCMHFLIELLILNLWIWPFTLMFWVLRSTKNVHTHNCICIPVIRFPLKLTGKNNIKYWFDFHEKHVVCSIYSIKLFSKVLSEMAKRWFNPYLILELVDTHLIVLKIYIRDNWAMYHGFLPGFGGYEKISKISATHSTIHVADTTEYWRQRSIQSYN